ncbi:MAG: nucleotidyltransferase [Thermoanaerobaculia bacterium]|nr:nucleotidyltransferase [Thermoanaerobaculia bacterium]
MTAKKLILTSYQLALKTLEEILERSNVDDVVRDATIQRFEYTYELAWKMLQRHLTWMGVLDVAHLDKRELFREAARAGIIENPEAWFDYHRARNETSHTYNRATALEVYETAKSFAPDARRLLTALEAIHG